MTARPSPRASRMQAELSALAREMRCSCKCWCSREVIRGRKRLPLSPASAGAGIWGGGTAVTQADTCSRAELVLSPYVLDRCPLEEELALTVARWSPPGRWAGNAFGRRSFVPLGWTLRPRWPQDWGRGQQGWGSPLLPCLLVGGWEWVPLFPFLEEHPKGKITFLFSKRNKTKMSGPWGHGGESAAPNMPWSSLPAVQH